MKKKVTKRPKPTHTIKITSETYRMADDTNETRYTTTISRGDKTLWSSTSQLYSRKVDAVTPARKFIRACREGRVEIVQ